MARTVGISFFYLNFVGEQLELELFPLILMENFLIRIWIRMKNFRIQDPDPYDNSYGSATLICLLNRELLCSDAVTLFDVQQKRNLGNVKIPKVTINK